MFCHFIIPFTICLCNSIAFVFFCIKRLVLGPNKSTQLFGSHASLVNTIYIYFYMHIYPYNKNIYTRSPICPLICQVSEFYSHLWLIQTMGSIILNGSQSSKPCYLTQSKVKVMLTQFIFISKGTAEDDYRPKFWKNFFIIINISCK